MVTQAVPSGQLVLAGVSWKSYLRLLRAFDNRHLRITYDRGALEVMILSYEHENWSYLLGRFVDAITEELHLPVSGGKSTTFKRRRKSRGLEPDNCYWIANEVSRGKTRIDLHISTRRLTWSLKSICPTVLSIGWPCISALGVPEIWRFDGQLVTFHVLIETQYQACSTSRSFPSITSDNVNRFLPLRGQLDTNAIVRQFRDWIGQPEEDAEPIASVLKSLEQIDAALAGKLDERLTGHFTARK